LIGEQAAAHPKWRIVVRFAPETMRATLQVCVRAIRFEQWTSNRCKIVPWCAISLRHSCAVRWATEPRGLRCSGAVDRSHLADLLHVGTRRADHVGGAGRRFGASD
jgi:hypothetical protein